MAREGRPVGPYTLPNLCRELRNQGPRLVLGLPDLASALRSDGRVRTDARLAVHLRMARLLGCPVCMSLLPRVGRAIGMSVASVEGAIEGRPADLSKESAGAVAWTDAIVAAGGEEPDMESGPGLELTSRQRRALLFVVRFEIVVHAAGLFFLPHSMIERAAGVRSRAAGQEG